TSATWKLTFSLLGDLVLDGSSTLTLTASSLQQLTRMFEQYLLPRSKQHGFLALPSHPADTASLLQLQFLFDVLQKTISLKLINPPSVRLQSVVKIFPFKSLKYLELKQIPPHCLEGLRGIYSQLEIFTCSKSLNTLEELLSLCGGDLSSALPWLELHTLNFSYNSIVCLDQSLSLLNALKSLDLSHNKIQECAEFLKPLSELQTLILSYNRLQRAPELSLSTRAKLVTLNLRNNELETINGVEQLSSLQHLDLAYNLLLEHSQLAPLSLLHCLNTLNLEGNPLYFHKTHRRCTTRHLSPKAANLRVSNNDATLGQQIHSQNAPPAVEPLERSHQEVSSGAGELSDSVSVPEFGATNFQKKRNRVRKHKVKVRRASISEPSDTDYETRWTSSTEGMVLPHQQEIERMSSFRDQLGEDWLRYQHHLDRASPNYQPCTQTPPLPNGGNAAALPSLSPNTLDVLPPPRHSETAVDPSDEVEDLETESTLQWPGHSPQPTESTLEDSVLDGLPLSQRRPRAGSKELTNWDSEDSKEDEEEDLGVDLCHPLLVGILSDKEEDDVGGTRDGSSLRREVFLCIKQGLALEVDMKHGRERCRLELSSLARVKTTEAVWTRGEVLPAMELHFDYISKDKRRRCYVLLDDDPHQALQETRPNTARGFGFKSPQSRRNWCQLSSGLRNVDFVLFCCSTIVLCAQSGFLSVCIQMSAIKFGELGEVPSLLVVSDRRIYFLEITSEIHKDQLSDWLQKRDSHPIVELSYLEVGLGSQSIHMQFGDGGAAYTLLARDSLRCKRFFGLLTGIVREMAHRSDSKLKSISTTRLSPQHHLWPLVCEDIQADVEDGQLQFFYILAFILQGDVSSSLTILATRETLYLLQEDHQWRKGPGELAAGEASSGAFTVLESLPISCVSSLRLWPSDGCRMDIELFDETVKQEKTWCVRAEGAELLQGLLAWVRAQWEAMFGVKLQTHLIQK
uniref:Serine/threonine-protein kinase 11-interacting protein n=1 Tax=Takifugu rubripes TaxID=31033 RepID=A0A674NEH1_TAKRU